ncbi:HNH endonuclease domain-containing protein [Mucilaginibacter sp. HD30]
MGRILSAGLRSDAFGYRGAEWSFKIPITERDIAESKALCKSILQSDGQMRCVWSCDTISRYDIDHIIPFTIWKNNDFGNLLAARPDLNNRKRYKIPSPALIDRQSGLITH